MHEEKDFGDLLEMQGGGPEFVAPEDVPKRHAVEHPGYTIHPAAEIIPPLLGEQLRALEANIARHGVLEPIRVTPDGQVLDGRTRYTVWSHLVYRKDMTGLELPVRTIDEPEDPVAYVLAANVARRQLSTGQRAAIASDMVPDRPGKINQCISALMPREEAGRFLGVSPRYISRYRAIQAESEDLARAVRYGLLTIPEAERKLAPTASKPPVSASEAPGSTRKSSPPRDRVSDPAPVEDVSGPLTAQERAQRVTRWLESAETEGPELWRELEYRIVREIAEAVAEAAGIPY